MHIPEPTLAELTGILRKHLPSGVQIFVFGSRASGRHLKKFSDLDLCLKGSQHIPQNVFSALHDAFEESDLPYRVDIVDWASLSPEFRAAIERTLVPLELDGHADMSNNAAAGHPSGHPGNS